VGRANLVVKTLVLGYVDGAGSTKLVWRLYGVEANLFYGAVNFVVGIPVRDEDPPGQKDRRTKDRQRSNLSERGCLAYSGGRDESFNMRGGVHRGQQERVPQDE
jgi:hypothetical protein